MGSNTNYIDDAATTLNNIKVNAAIALEKAGATAGQILGSSVKVVAGVGLGTGIVIDMTLGNEPIEQAVISQVAAQLAGGAALVGLVALVPVIVPGA
jgi:hypothetical protein